MRRTRIISSPLVVEYDDQDMLIRRRRGTMLSLFAKVCVLGELFNYIDKLPLPRELLISILWSMSTGIKLDFK